MTNPVHVPHGGKVKSKFGFERATWRILMLLVFIVLAATGFFVSVAKGAVTMNVSQVVHILLEPGSDSLSQIIWNIRLPRSIVGALVGMNLAL